MAHESATERQAALRAGRWASRALLVLGGVAAGTAAAWAISSASASAETIVLADGTPATNASVTPVTDATVAGLHDVSHGTAGFVGETSGVVSATWRDAACQQDVSSWSAPESEQLRPAPAWCAKAAREQIGGPIRQGGAHAIDVDQEVAGRVSDAIGNFADDSVVVPGRHALGVVEHIVSKPEDAGQLIKDSLTPSPEAQDFGKKFWSLLNPGGHDGLIQLPGLPGQHGLGTGIPADAAHLDTSAVGGVQSGLHAGNGANIGAAVLKATPLAGHRDLPTPFAPTGLPFAPVSAPSVPGSGSAPGGHVDGPAFGLPAWSSALLDNAKPGSADAGLRYMPLTPGSQPGVTPD